MQYLPQKPGNLKQTKNCYSIIIIKTKSTYHLLTQTKTP